MPVSIVSSFSANLPSGSASLVFFFFNDTATTEIYTLSLHDALPISQRSHGPSALPPRQSEAQEYLRDRKSTRLNSSHANISYAVFCLKKKNQHHRRQLDVTVLEKLAQGNASSLQE